MQQTLGEITAAFINHTQSLQGLLDQMLRLGKEISKMTDKFDRIDRDMKVFKSLSAGPFPEPPSAAGLSGGDSAEGEAPLSESGRGDCSTRKGPPSNIIPFSGAGNRKKENPRPSLPFLARPGETLPANIPDFRSSLERDGLILLAWDKRVTEKGERFTAYWITSAGTPRFYASKSLPEKEFPRARPDHKSYAAEDGIEFYGQEAPACLVHAAPELMKSNPLHDKLREAYIKLLKQQGSKVDFNYRYLLTVDKTQGLPQKAKDMNNERMEA